MKDELKETLFAAAKECFEANKEIKILHVATDTNCFVKETDAATHSRRLADAEILVVTREEATGSKAGKPELAAVLIEKIQAATTAEEVDALLTEGEKRPTVLDAAAAKKTELHNSK